MNSSNFREEARKRLSDKWGKVAIISLAYWAFFFLLGFIGGLIPEKSLVSLLYSIATYLIEIPLAFGLIIVFYKLYHSEDAKAFDFVQLGFDNFKKAWGVALHTALKLIVPFILMIISYFLIIASGIGAFVAGTASTTKSGVESLFLLTFLGFILLVVSIIWLVVKSYYYQLSQIIAIENPDLTSKEAVLRSKELMKNKRGKLFCLQFSFIGWIFLAALTFGIGMLWLMPYMQFAIFAFYDFAKGNSNQVEIIDNVDNGENNHPISEN